MDWPNQDPEFFRWIVAISAGHWNHWTCSSDAGMSKGQTGRSSGVSVRVAGTNKVMRSLHARDPVVKKNGPHWRAVCIRLLAISQLSAQTNVL
jgi:hypothetical protein